MSRIPGPLSDISLPRAVVGGYRRQETDELLGQAVSTLRELWDSSRTKDDEIRSLEAEVRDLRMQLEQARELEHRIAQAYGEAAEHTNRIRERAEQAAKGITEEAERKAAELRRQSEAESGRLVQRARERAEEITTQADAELSNRQSELNWIRDAEAELRSQLRRVLSTLQADLEQPGQLPEADSVGSAPG